MFKQINKRLKNRKGFTLVELIVVIAILGILATLAVPRFIGMKDKAEQAVDQETIITLNKMIELYHVEHGDYPDTETEVDDAIGMAFDSNPDPHDTSNSFYYNEPNHEFQVEASGSTDINLIELD